MTPLNKKTETKIDWTAVISYAEEYISEVHREGIISDELDDYPERIFEAVIEAIYGKEAWDEINSILKDL